MLVYKHNPVRIELPPGIELVSHTCNNFLLFVEFAKLLAMQMEMTTTEVHYLKEPEGCGEGWGGEGDM